MTKQLQENQLALTEGLDKNRLAITQGFDKMDEVKKWDLLQLPAYEAIEEPEEYKKRDDDDDDDDEQTEEKYKIPVFDVPVRMKQKDYYKIMGYTHITPDHTGQIYTVNFKEIGDKLNNFNYNYDKDENLTTLVGKKRETIAQFKFEDLDKGLVYKEAKDILDEYGLRRLPSEYLDKSIEKVYSKLEKVQKYLNDIKLK